MTNRIKELVLQLNQASKAYYKYDNPIMTDQVYDKLYDELTNLEKETGIILSNSPTQKVQGEILESLSKVLHSRPMLSAQKTKSIDDIIKFSGNKDVVLSYKMDGLTILVRYNNGKLIQAITRGTGEIGEDVTHSAKMFSNLPMTIPYKSQLEVRGECVISWDNFKKINEDLSEKYSHPRNLAAGSCRQLNSNIAKERFLEFIAFDLIGADKWDEVHSKHESLDYLNQLGFDTVQYKTTNGVCISEDVKEFNPIKCKYPVDGVICEYDDLKYAMSLGKNAHHENRLIALKWKDETADTTLLDVEWSMGRTDTLTPVAIFETVDLDGTDVSRASLHNISIIENLKLGIGDNISVAKMNMIIPQIVENYTQSNSLKIPDICPICGGKTEIEQLNDSKELICTNSNCKGKLLGKFVHFVSKPAMNIEGLSESTLEKFIDKGWLKTFSDIYDLSNHKSEIINMDGFGEKSYNKLIQAIENSRNVKLENFIVALGIDNIGKTASKTISKYFKGDWVAFETAYIDNFDFTTLEDFGQTINDSLYKYLSKGEMGWFDLIDEVTFIKPNKPVEVIVTDNLLNGKKVYATGTFANFKKTELQTIIEGLGATFSSGYAKSLDYLIVGSLKGSGKEDKARADGVRIMSEEEFCNVIK